MDDWSHIPARNAVSEPAPNPQSTMTTTTLAASLTRPSQAPPTGTDHPYPHTQALDPGALARRTRTQSGTTPGNCGNPGLLTIRPPEQPHERQRPPHSPLTSPGPSWMT